MSYGISEACVVSSVSILERLNMTMPPKAKIMQTISNNEICSEIQQYDNSVVVNIYELNIIDTKPSGMYFVAATNVRKQMVPTQHLNTTIDLSFTGIELKNVSLNVYFIRKAEAIMLKAERINENSNTVTPRFTSMSFVRAYRSV